MTTIATIAREIGSNDEGQLVNAICGYLGHIPNVAPDTELDADDEALVREAFGA